MFTQVFALCLFSSAFAGAPYRAPASGIPYGTSYTSTQRSFDTLKEVKPQPYSFNFDVKDEYGTALNRREEGDELGNKKGSYGYSDAYGISRQVDYIADDKGFRATIKTNEPGTDNQNAADVDIQSSVLPYQGPSPYDRSSASVYNQQAPTFKAESAYETAAPGGLDASVNRQPIPQAYSTSAGDKVLPSANRSPVSTNSQLQRSSVYEGQAAPVRVSLRSYSSAITANTHPGLSPPYGGQVAQIERVSPHSSAVTTNAQPKQSFPNSVQAVNVPLSSNSSTGNLSTGLRTNARLY